MIKIRHGHPILYASNVLSILDNGQKRIESRSALIFQWSCVNRRDSVVVRASASQSVNLEFIPLVASYQQTLKNGIHSLPAWRSAFMGGCGEQAGSFACCVVGQALNGTVHLYVEDRRPRHLGKGNSQASADIPSKNITIQFTFS